MNSSLISQCKIEAKDNKEARNGRQSEGLMKMRQSLPQLRISSNNNDNADSLLLENKSAILPRTKLDTQISDEWLGSKTDIDPKIQKQRSHNQKRLETIYAENKGYFAHLMRSCLCGVCTCGKCKCDYSRQLQIPTQSFNKTSLYRDTHNWKVPYDFRRVKAPREAIPALNSKLNDSIYKQNYRVPDSEHFALQNNWHPDAKNKDSEDGTKHIKAPFPLNTSYKENYPNWEYTKRPIIIRTPVESTTDKRFPFFAHVVNNEYGNFRPEDIQKNFDSSKFGIQQFKNPIGPEIKLQMTTTHGNTFQKPDSSGKAHKLKTQNINFGCREPAYLNQFKTSYQNLNQSPPEVCPAQKILIGMARQSTAMNQDKNLVC